MEDIIDIIVTETTNTIEITAQPNDEIIDVNIIDNREDVTLNVTPTVVEININSLTGNFGILWGEIEGTLSNQTDLNNALALKANLVGGKVPASELPSYVDDVVEVSTFSALPATGEIGKIYVILDTNKIYRWSGSVYVEIADSTAVWGAITGTLSNQTDLQNALNAKQDDLNGTGFVKALGTTISYDNSTYLTTIAAASTYLALAGGTLTGALNGTSATFTGDLTLSSGNPRLYFTDTDNNPDYFISNTDGTFTIYDVTNSTSRFTIGTTGNGTFGGNLTVGQIIRSGGTSAQFLKADGSVDSSTYALDSAVVKLTGNQTIAGIKTMSNVFKLDDTLQIKNIAQLSNNTGYTGVWAETAAIGFYTGANAIRLLYAGNYNYTMPSADGTLALTSQLSAYLPLSGGTLTGALNGTSALFSGVVRANNPSEGATGEGLIAGQSFKIDGTGTSQKAVMYMVSNVLSDTYASGLTAQFGNFAGDKGFGFNLNTSGGYELYVKNTTWNKAITVANTGAVTLTSALSGTSATFSGAIQGNGLTLLNSSGTYASWYVGSYLIGRIGNVDTNDMYYDSTFGGNHIFRTGTLGTTSPSNKMIINSYGNVGIGTTSPNEKLVVKVATNQNLEIRQASSLGAYNGIGLDALNDARNTVVDLVLRGTNLSLISSGATPMILATNSTERMRITSGGNVGIGTTSPSNRLSVYESTGSTTSTMDFSTIGNSIKGHIGMWSNNFYITSNWFYNGSQNADNTGYGLNAIGFYNSGFMSFLTSPAGSTSPSERMRITSTGNVGIGTTSPGAKLEVVDTNGSQLLIGYSTTATNYYDATTHIFRATYGGTERMRITSGGEVLIGTTSDAGDYKLQVNGRVLATDSIYSNGDVVAYASSDIRLKDNILPIKNALEKVKKIGGYTFDWNNKQTTYEGHDVGVIAQEIEAVLPEVVTTRDNGYKAVKYEKLTALLIESIKEQQVQIERLELLINKLTK